MNPRMFPVHLKNARRLRRSAVSKAESPKATIQFAQNCSWSSANSGTQSLTSETSPIAESKHWAISKTCSNSLDQSHWEMCLRQQAMDQAQQGNLAEAIDLFTQLISCNPNNASNFNNRGLLHFQNGHFEKALADYNMAVLLNPRLAKVYNNRANCHALLGDLDTAIADYERAIDLDPTDLRARLNQGITLRQLGLFEAAIETLDLALQCSQFLNTTDIVGVPASLEGHLYAERGRATHLAGDWNYAIADYHRALARLPISSTTISRRLRAQVKAWLDDLLNPLQP